MPRLISSWPALQNHPESAKRGSSKLREYRRQCRSPPGAWSVNGFIRDGYRQRGGPGGALGFPGTDEGPTFDGVGRFNHFQNGSIYWTPELGAHDIGSAIRATWAALGWERAELGYPITDQLATPDGEAFGEGEWAQQPNVGDEL